MNIKAKSLIVSQFTLLLASAVVSFAITHSVGILALGVGGTENSKTTDSFIQNIIIFVIPHRMNFACTLKSHFRSDNPEEWANCDRAEEAALNKDISYDTFYLYILFSLVYYPIQWLKKKKIPVPLPPPNY